MNLYHKSHWSADKEKYKNISYLYFQMTHSSSKGEPRESSVEKDVFMIFTKGRISVGNASQSSYNNGASILWFTYITEQV